VLTLHGNDVRNSVNIERKGNELRLCPCGERIGGSGEQSQIESLALQVVELHVSRKVLRIRTIAN